MTRLQLAFLYTVTECVRGEMNFLFLGIIVTYLLRRHVAEGSGRIFKTLRSIESCHQREGQKMLLAIDVGNTNTVIGIFDGKQAVGFWRIRTVEDTTVDENRIILHNLAAIGGIEPLSVDGAIVSCVVPPLMGALEEFCSRALKITPLFVGPGIKSGMPIRYDNPREVGADRIVNAVAAYEKYGGDLIAVEFGDRDNF